LLKCIPEGWNYQWLTNRGGGEELFGYRTRYWHFLLKLAKSLPSWTLPASPGPAAGPFHWDNRPLTARERLRLQSFPDDWRLAGSISSQTKQAGNATPPLLAEVFGIAVTRAINYDAPARIPTLLLNKTPIPALPGRVEPIPAEFLSLVGTRAAHLGTGKGPATTPSIRLSTTVTLPT